MVKPSIHSKTAWKPSALSLAIVLFAAAFVAGCSGSSRPKAVPVSGQVTYEGKPVVGATVEFLCPGAPRPATGITDGQGKYRLTTFEPDDGAIVGMHVITINVFASDAEASLPVPAGGGSKAMTKAIDDAVNRSARNQSNAENAASRVPARYSDRRTSELQQEVVGGDNIIDIELHD